MLQVEAELKETKKRCEGLKNDLFGSLSADLETTLSKKEEESQILSQVKEQAAAADNENIDGGASLSPPVEGKAVDGERDGETVPRVPPAVGGGGGGLRKSQSSSAMFNISLASPSGGGKAVNGEQDGEIGGGGLCRSQSSNTILNTSPPAAVGTPQGDGKKMPSPESKRTYAMIVAGVKSAPSPLNTTSQQQPPSPCSSSHPTPMVSKPYCICIKFNDDYGFESLATI